MTIQEIKIKVDIPDGWELEAYREVRPGEHRLMQGGLVDHWDCNFNSTWQYFILRKAWQPPAWLRATECKYVWRRKGVDFASKVKPVVFNGMWQVDGYLPLGQNTLLPFTHPCGPEVPDLETLRSWE